MLRGLSHVLPHPLIPISIIRYALGILRTPHFESLADHCSLLASLLVATVTPSLFPPLSEMGSRKRKQPDAGRSASPRPSKLARLQVGVSTEATAPDDNAELEEMFEGDERSTEIVGISAIYPTTFSF